MFDASGKEVATQKVLKPEAVQAYNKNLPSNYRTGATPSTPEGLEPYHMWDTDIDWGKWNPEILKNEKLMQEYIEIENNAKWRDNNWMKNPDGSPFAGTPEQFIQSRSENFKKAFPEGVDITYRGDNEHYPELRPKADRWYGEPIFTANEGLARFYTAKGKQAGYFNPNEPTALENLQKYVSQNYPDMTTQEFMEKYPTLARGAMATEEGGIHQLAIPKTTNKLQLDAKGKMWTNLDDPEMNKKITDLGVEKLIDNKDTGSDLFTTDDVAQYIKQKGINRAEIKNVDDGILGHVLIHNQKPGNYAKSLRGNNGMFNMNDPNIYKALIPAVGTAGIVGASQKKNGGWLDKYK
jgi:hypothetical protein